MNLNMPWKRWLVRRFQYHQAKTFGQRDILIFVYRQGYLYLVLILISFIAGINYANNLVLSFCFLISAILAISFYVTFKQLHGLEIEIVTDEVGQVGEPLQLHFYFKQAQAQSRFLYLRLGDEEQAIYLNQLQEHHSFSILPAQRGRFQYPDIRIYSVYPFGLVRVWSYFFHELHSWVAPLPMWDVTEQKTDQLPMNLEKDDFHELRRFQAGDALQAVSWKQVARGQGLFIKVFEQQQPPSQVEINYAHIGANSHEEKLQRMMGRVLQCEQLQVPYSLQLPQQHLDAGIGMSQLQSAKRILAQA